MTDSGPRRLLVLVPAHHDAGGRPWARLDRRGPLVACLHSLLAAADYWRSHGTGLAFAEVGIVLVDDGSPVPLSCVLPAGLLRSVDVLRLDARKGQGAALNAALRSRPATAYAITDSDCVVALDWMTTIEKLAECADGSDGAAGPPWPHLPPLPRRKAAWLTAQETALVRACTERAVREGAPARLDCRNVWLRAGLVDRLGRETFFPEAAGAALSGMTSRLLTAAGARLSFDPALAVRHQPVGSVVCQVVTYYSRGSTSDLDEHYAKSHGSLSRAFVEAYLRRHFVDPVRAGVSPAYVLLAHGAYWCGLARRHRSRSRAPGKPRAA